MTAAILSVVILAMSASAAIPTIKFEVKQPETALLGTNQTVELFAENPEGQPRGYNLSFRAVLPAGVKYVGGGSPSAVIAEAPNPGETTLIFENVSDLSPKSSYSLSFEVEPSHSIFKLSGNKNTYVDKAQAFISEKPRRKPNFSKTTGKWLETTEEKSVIAATEKSATTELTAIKIEKSEPSPEGEILRGVHEHQTVYTLKVKNNRIGPTEGLTGQGAAGKSNKSIIVEDWLPAGLEFLGCGKTDNTTNTATNPNSREEYPGSGPIDPGNAPAVAHCIEPFYVKTEAEVQPPGKKMPKGTYTHVKWEGPESLATSEEFEIQYVAAIPLRQNSTTWLGAEPAPEGGGVKQIANLNNNTGPETVDEEVLKNNAQARGKYEATEVKDNFELERTAEDLAIQKSASQSKIYDGAETTWSLNLETSEYRRSEPVSITDQLPNGLCPIGPRNYENPTEPMPECAASPSRYPTVKYVKGGPSGKVGRTEQIEYSVAKELPTGGFELQFNGPEVEALSRMEPSQELLITYPTTTRVFYQKNYKSEKPILTKDSWKNTVSTQAPSYSRCYVEPTPGTYQADPNCERSGTKPIAATRAEGALVTDVSSAGQEAGEVEIEKTVRKNEGAVPMECTDPSSDYVKGLLSKEAALPKYRPGDQICWRLVVRFPSNIYSGNPVVTDFIPPDQQLVPNSEVAGPSNNVESTFNETAAKEELLEWKLGATESVQASKLFEVRFKTEVSSLTSSEPGEISGNLMKFSFSNSNGVTFPLRDRAEVERQEPNLELKKRVLEINGAAAPGATAVSGGDEVKFGIEIPNTGTLKAEGIEVWDNLPAGIECGAQVTKATIGNGGTCEGTGRIVWKNVSVGAKETAGPLTYVVKIPAEVAPGHAFANRAGITRFESQTNTGTPFTYLPKENINPAVTEEMANTGPARAEAKVTTTGATIEKNGPAKATIGEIAEYEVKATIPGESTLYGTPRIADEMPANLKFVVGSASATLNGGALPAGKLKLEETANGAAVRFEEATYTNSGAEADTIRLILKGRVANSATNTRGVPIVNQATFRFKDRIEEGAARELPPASATTTVVEPLISVSKGLVPSNRSSVVKPGESVEYSVKASNSSALNVSTANEVTLVDSIPTGMEVVSAGEGTVEGENIVWKVGAIAPGASVTKTYKLKVKEPATAASTFTNKVVATTQSLPAVGGVNPPETRVASFQEGSYKASAGGYEASATKTVSLVGASVSKEVEPTAGTIGTPLTYRLHMKLPPQINFYDTTMVDTLPNGIAYYETVSAKCVKGCEGTVTGETLTPKAGEGGVTYVGWFFGAFAAGPERELEVVLKANVAGTKSGGSRVVAGETLTNSVVGLYNKAAGTKPTQTPTPGAGKNTYNQETAKAEAPFSVLEPNLTVEKSVTGSPALAAGTPPIVQPGTALTYTLKVKNTGSSTAYGFEVVDTSSANLRNFKPGTAPNGATLVSKAGESPIWQVESLGANGELEFTYTAELAPSGELKTGDEVKNAVSIPKYFGLSAAERKTAEEENPKRAKEGKPEREVREYAKVEAARQLKVELPKIEVEKTTGAAGFPKEASAEVNQPFPWRVVVKNTAANAGAKAAGVRDVLPPNWAYVAGSASFTALGKATIKRAFDPATETVGSVETLTWSNIAELPAGSGVEVRFQATPSRAAAEEGGSGIKTNAATGRFLDLSGAAGGAGTGGEYARNDFAYANLLFPKLSIEKTPDEGSAIAGDPAAYTIHVRNSGTGVAHEVQVKDVLSAGQKFIAPASANPTTGFVEKSVEANTPGAGQTTIVWTIATIPAATGPSSPGEVTITVPIKPEPSLAEKAKVSDVAEASAPQSPPAKPDEGSFIVKRQADLRIAKTLLTPNVVAGEEIEYNLQVTNKGPSNADPATVTDVIPGGTEFVSADAPCAFAATNGTITCELGELPAGFEHGYKVKLKVLSATTGSIVNKAAISSSTEDPKPENNSSSVESTVQPQSGLSIVKRGPQNPVLLGSTFGYEIEVANHGPSDAVAVEVEDPLPAEVQFVSAEAPCEEGAPGKVLCPIGTLISGQTKVLHFEVKAVAIPAGGVPVRNVATVSSETEKGVTHEAEAQTEVLPAADLAITKTAPATVEPNGELTYKLHVENLGPSIAHKVTITDPLPAGVEFVTASTGCANAAGVVTCTVQPKGELAVGGTADFLVTVHVPFALGGQSLTNTASVKGEEADPNTGNDQSTVTTIVGPAADLSITKTMGKAEAGKPLTYTLAVTNKGPSASSAVTVKDTLPAGTTFKTAAPSQGTCGTAGQEVTCQLGELAASGSAQVSITVEVGATVTGTLRNTAKVEGPEPDPDKSNNESTVEGPVTPAALVSPGTPNLSVLKTADTSTPQVGTPFDYHVTVSNLSGAEAKEVKVVDTLNGPAKVLSIETSAGKCEANGSKINCTIPSIPVGKTVHITYSVVAEAAGPLSNTASAQAANGESAPTNNHAVKGVRAKAGAANFTLTKTAAKKVVDGGKKVAFTITLHNGPTALVNATICDRLPAALVFVKAAGASFVKGEACWQKKFVAAKRTLKLHLTARAVRGYKPRKARNVASASAENAPGAKHASATVRIKPAFAGAPGGVTG